MRKILFTTANTIADAKRRLGPHERFVRARVQSDGVAVWVEDGVRRGGRRAKRSTRSKRRRY